MNVLRPREAGGANAPALAPDEKYSFASNIKDLLDSDWSIDGNATEYLVGNNTIEGIVCSNEILARLKAAFARERASNEVEGARTVAGRKMRLHAPALFVTHDPPERSSPGYYLVNILGEYQEWVKSAWRPFVTVGPAGMRGPPFISIDSAGNLRPGESKAVAAGVVSACRAAARALRARCFAPIPVEILSARKARELTRESQEIDPVADLSVFVAALLKGEADTAADPELPDAADEWAVLFDTRIKPGATDEFRFNDDRLGNLNDDPGGEEDDVEAAHAALHHRLREPDEPGDRMNAPGWEVGMQQLGHFFDIGVSIDATPSHSRRTAFGSTRVQKPLGERATREWEAANKWSRTNASSLLPAPPKYRARNDFNRRAGFGRAIRRVFSIICHDPTMWARLCAAYERLPPRMSDRNNDLRDMQALDWLMAVEDSPRDERDRQIVLCWLREGLPQSEFARAKGLTRKQLRMIVDRYCTLIADRVNAAHTLIAIDQRGETYDVSVVRGVNAIAAVTRRSLNSTMRLISDPKSPVAMLNGEPAALRKLIEVEPYRLRKKASSPCSKSNHAKPLLAAE
jgi:hypothetical protein